MNVLLTSAGRRTSLLQFFQSAASEQDGAVWAGDADPLAPTLQIASHSIALPPIQDRMYVPTLLDRVETLDLDIVIPLIDPDVQALSSVRHQFLTAGCQPLLSTPSFLELVHDKWKTVKHFSENGIRTPSSWRPAHSSPEDWPDPAFIKPRRGSASKNAQRVGREHASSVAASINAPLLQEVIEAPEITIDALFDLDGTLIHYVPRLRIRTMAGESIQGRTLSDPDLHSWLRHLLPHLGTIGARGPITVQAFRTDPDPTLLEINPRFGGGFPLTHAAGGRYPKWILQMCNGTSVSPRLGDYKTGLCMTRAYTEWFADVSSLPEST